jgi:hypothetical protein
VLASGNFAITVVLMQRFAEIAARYIKDRNLLFVGLSMPRRQLGVKDYDDAICSAQQDLTNLAIENV